MGGVGGGGGGNDFACEDDDEDEGVGTSYSDEKVSRLILIALMFPIPT